MKKHIFEHGGVLLHVLYKVGSDSIPEFNSVHVLDENYRPVGPDLTCLLRDTLLKCKDQPPTGPTEAADFLSTICEEIYNDSPAAAR